MRQYSRVAIEYTLLLFLSNAELLHPSLKNLSFYL